MIAVLLAALLTACPAAGTDSATVPALNCMPLYATPDLPRASGSIALRPISSPFGVTVTDDGRPRYHLVATIAGLPEPTSLGPFDSYVAWAYTLALDSAVKLGRVRNGTVDLGELSYVQFRILISTERGDGGADRAGRLVLRGTSPSARLLAHRDLVQPSAPGALRDSAPSPAVIGSRRDMKDMRDMHAIRGERGGRASGPLAWSMPPVSGRMAMMPGMVGLVPRAVPYLPSSAVDDTSGAAIIRARDGDTITLRASAIHKSILGRAVTMLGFNGRSPGPMLEVDQGATIAVRVENRLDAQTSMHWHGIRLDNPFDGAVGITQSAIEQGGVFTYTVRFPDAGVFWYHPHVREDAQQSLGLFGNVLVRPRAPHYYATVDREMPLILSDILADSSGLTPFGEDTPTHALMGRFGNVLLVNGEQRPAITVRQNDVVRFFVTNVSASRIYNLSWPGARLKVVGADVGKFEREEWARSVVIAPAERYIVEVKFAATGTTPFVNRVQALDHMIGSYTPEVDTLAFIRVTDGGAAPAAARPAEPPTNRAAGFDMLRRNADVAADIARYRRDFDRPVDKSLVLTLRTRGLPAPIANMLQGINAAVEWNDGMPMMNWLTTGNEIQWVLRDAASGKENMDIAWRFRRGDVVKLRIFNNPSSSHAMAHPIHIHGQRFLVLARDGVPAENLAWKDTTIIPAGETVDLLVDMSNPGRWMLHCHIAEHLSSGMMSSFVVE